MIGFALVILSIFLLGANFTSSAAPIDDVSLGQAASYSILAGTALTKGDMSSISGAPSDAGIFPGTVAPDVAALFASTGASSFHNGDAAAGLAQGDLVTAIAAIASLTTTRETSLLSNETLTPGIYAAPAGNALAITVGLVLDGQNNPDARFIFRTDVALNIDASITIALINGVQARNVYWLVGSAVTVGAGANLPGNLLVVSAATIGANAIIHGSILCQGAVTLGANSSIIFDPLTAPLPLPSPSDTLSPSPSPSPIDTLSPSPSPTPTESARETPSPSPTPAATPEPSPYVAPSQPPVTLPPPVITPTPLPPLLPQPVDTFTPTPFVSPEPTPSATPESVPLLSPIELPSPSASPRVSSPPPTPAIPTPAIPNPHRSTTPSGSIYQQSKSSAVDLGPPKVQAPTETLAISPNSKSSGNAGESIHISLQNIAIGDQITVTLQSATHG